MKAAFSSIRNRLILAVVATIVAALLLFSFAVYSLVRSGMTAEMDEGLERDFQVLLADTSSGANAGGVLIREGSPLIATVRAEGKPPAATPGWTDAGLDEALESTALDLFEWQSADGTLFRVRRGYAPQGYLIAAARDLTQRELLLDRLFLVLAGGLVVFICGGALMGWAVASGVVRPLEVLAAQAQRITPQTFSARLVPTNAADEAGVVASSFNRTLDRLESAFLQLQRFASDASHQLRTPLTAIRATGETALSQSQGEEHLRSALEGILEETDRLDRLVQNLLLLTRWEGEKNRPRLEVLIVSDAIRDCLETLEVLAEEKQLTLEKKIDPSVRVRGDRELVHQAFMNLLDNAIQYTPPGGRVTVEGAADGGIVRIRITDTGHGIAERDKERVFDRFYRSTEAARISRQGSGLGLPIARWCAEACAGTLTLVSTSADGSVLEMTLPTVSP